MCIHFLNVYTFLAPPVYDLIDVCLVYIDNISQYVYTFF